MCYCWLAVRPRQRDALGQQRDSGTLGLAGRLEKIAFGMHRHVSVPLHSTISLASIKIRKKHKGQTGNAKESIISFSARSYIYIQTHTHSAECNVI